MTPTPDLNALTRRYADRSFDECRADFDRDGYFIFENVLPADEIARLRAALDPYLDLNIKGRNNFEGLASNRVYAMLAKSPIFAELVTHKLALAFVEDLLGIREEVRGAVMEHHIVIVLNRD